MFASLPPVTRQRTVRHNSPVQQSPFTSPVPSQDQSSTFTPVRDYSLVLMAQHPPVNMEDLLRYLQQAIETMQQHAACQIEVTAYQAEMINRLQQQQPQQAATSNSNAPPVSIPAPGVIINVQENLGNLVDPIPPQASKAPVYQIEALFEFEVDPTALKGNKLEKLFKRAQGVNSIPDIKDRYTDSAVTLPDRFKMLHIDRFNGFGDPTVHLRLFSDILQPMGLTRLQKLSLFGRTLLGIAAIWYAKLEDSMKRSWEEMAEAFIAQYSYNTHIEVTTRNLEGTRQEPKEGFSDFVTSWRAKASMMTTRPFEKDQIRMVVRNLQGKLLQKIIVLPLFTFTELHEIGV